MATLTEVASSFSAKLPSNAHIYAKATTLESGIDVGQGINVGLGKFVKKNKRRALNKRRA